MIRPLQDWVLVELEPGASRVTGSGLHLVGEDPVRMARVLAVGSGRRVGKKEHLIPTEVKPGERVAFFIASVQTKQGAQVFHSLPENQALIKESDILIVDDGGDARITR
jgi:co-chaperonin GroES (HSP10)